MIRYLTFLFACALTLATNASIAASDSRIAFDAVGLSIAAPPGFVKAQRFNGLENTATGSSVVLVILPGPYRKVTTGLTSEGLAGRGIVMHSRENASIDGKRGILLDVEQSAYGQTFRKWIAAYGDDTSTTLITANYRAEMVVEAQEPLKQAVLSVQSTAANSAGPPAEALFTLNTSTLLKPVNAIAAMGKMLAYTRSGKFPLEKPQDPFFLAAPSLGLPPMEDHKQAALQRLKSMANTTVGSVTKNTEVQIDGMQGIEIFATGENSKTATPIQIYQVMLFPRQGGYYLMAGQVGSRIPGAGQAVAEFQKLAHSFRRSKKN